MSNKTRPAPPAMNKPSPEALRRVIQAKYASLAAMRRGICLLNAGRIEEAAAVFAEVLDDGYAQASLASLLAACYRAKGEFKRAAEITAQAVEAGPDQVCGRVRHALSLWSAGDREAAVRLLRDAIRRSPECAEYHFQLGTLLCCLESYEEAELRFTQAINLDRHHVDASINLAMCCGLRGAATEAVAHLQRAQSLHPGEPRIGLMLAQAVQAARQQGLAAHVHARMIDEADGGDREGIEELSQVIEHDPDFVDAFLSIPVGDLDEQVYALLLRTIEAALERQPEHAELHFHCGRLLERLGRHEDAIARNERAVTIDPTFTRALIELGRLYQRTDRRDDAATRLEQAIRAGAEYADVYFMLGSLHRDQGRLVKAKEAFRRALTLNDRYEAARRALDALPA